MPGRTIPPVGRPGTDRRPAGGKAHRTDRVWTRSFTTRRFDDGGLAATLPRPAWP